MPIKAEAAILEKTIVYQDQATKFEGFLVYDDSLKSPLPGVLVIHDWLGVTDKTKEKAREFAKLGYLAFAVDIYGQGVRPTGAAEAGKLATIYKADRKLYRQRLSQGLAVLAQQAKVEKTKLVAVGYCFGGTGAIELARAGADLKGVVSFHGGLDSPEPALGKKIKAKVLALHGADDPFVKESDLAAFENEMREAKVDWQIIKYGNAVHSFTDKSAGNDASKGAAYNELADKRSWEDMQLFLADL